MAAQIMLPEAAVASLPVKAALVADLTREECGALMRWCDGQTESLWSDLSLQEILNVYRVSHEWDTWEGWRSEEFNEAGRAWDRAMIDPGHKLEFPTRRGG